MLLSACTSSKYRRLPLNQHLLVSSDDSHPWRSGMKVTLTALINPKINPTKKTNSAFVRNHHDTISLRPGMEQLNVQAPACTKKVVKTF
jgi:hypothetical protein